MYGALPTRLAPCSTDVGDGVIIDDNLAQSMPPDAPNMYLGTYLLYLSLRLHKLQSN